MSASLNPLAKATAVGAAVAGPVGVLGGVVGDAAAGTAVKPAAGGAFGAKPARGLVGAPA